MRDNPIKRMLDEMPLDYPAAHVALIDALREYIRTCENDGDDLLREGSITKADYHAGRAMRRERRLLADLEKFHIDPTLQGTLKP